MLGCAETRVERRRVWSVFVLVTVTSMLFLYNWVADSVQGAHVMPKVERYDLKRIPWFVMEPKEVVQLLAEQTGLCEKTVLKLLGENRGDELLRLQEIYFSPTKVESFQTTPLTVSEWLVGTNDTVCRGMPLVDVQNGDILITKNSRFLGWRNGHAGLVVDAENGLVLEALMLGAPSKLCSIARWEKYPSFQILRLKEEYNHSEWSVQGKLQFDKKEGVWGENTAGNIAAYAKETLVDVPYHLLADILRGPKDESFATLSGTHCAHLVWYAYNQFGIDLDSDGGIVVTPEDIRNSPYLEVVQSYGY